MLNLRLQYLSMTDWKVIISSRSGGGKAGQIWCKVAESLKKKGISFSEAFTEYQSHAIELAKQAIRDGYRKILAVGGDGAVHEILNGIMGQTEVPSTEVTLAIVPVGSGNDWARLHKIPHDLEKAADVIAAGRTVVQDIVQVETINGGNPFKRFMLNIGGFGFDAQVCHLFEQAKKKGRYGDAQYLKCLIKGFLFYKCPSFDIKIDGKPFFSGKALSVAIGNGKYCGGGMMQTPAAVCDDGLMDITVVRQLWKLKFISKIKCLYDGSIYDIDEVSAGRGKKFEIKAAPATFVEADGEAVGITPATLTIIPGAINVITNRQ